MPREIVILVTLVVYQLVLIGIGLWAQRRTRDDADYFLGGRRLGAFVAAISYAASSSSAWTLLGVSGAAFSFGLGAVWLLPGIVTCHVIAWFRLAPRLRELAAQHGHITVTDLLTHDTSGKQRQALVVSISAIVIFCFMIYVASQLQGAGKTFSSNFEIELNTSIILGAAIVLVYTLLGGFWAVSVTDAVQGILMCVAAVLLPTAALIAVGGPNNLIEGLKAVSSADQLSWTQGNAGLLGVGFAIGFAAIGLGSFGQPQLLNRFMALRDDRALRQARILAIAWFIVVLAGMLLLGLCGHVLRPLAPDSESLFFQLTGDLLPALVAGIVTAAVLSAIMSTVDSNLLVAASAVSHDLGVANRWPGKTLLVSRLVMAVVCASAVAIAIWIPATIFSRVLFAWNGLGAAFGPLIFALAAGQRVPAAFALGAMWVGFALTAWFHATTPTPGAVAERTLPFIASGLIVLIGSIRTRRTLRPGEPYPHK